MNWRGNMNNDKIEKIIGYHFKDQSILKNALTHSSFINDKSKLKNNERLEFLGDAVLELVVSHYLYKNCNNRGEGEMTKLRAKIVCTDSLAMAASDFQLGDYIYMGKGEENTGGRTRKSILANTFEAIIGAIFIDGGLEEARKFILCKLKNNIDDSLKGKLVFDYKTKLQEYIQQNADNDIDYVVISEEGPEHDKIFNIELLLNGKVIGSGSGSSKKEAEQHAAYNGLIFLGEVNEK